jgi:hypothetical protein
MPGRTEHPLSQHHHEETPEADAVDMADCTGLVSDEQTNHRTLTPGEKNVHDPSKVACKMLEDIRANRSDACVDAGDTLPADKPVSDADEQQIEEFEQGRRTSTAGLGSETFPPPCFAPNISSPPGLPVSSLARMVVSTSPALPQMELSHQLESVALRSSANLGKEVNCGSGETVVLGTRTAAGQPGIIDEGTAETDISSCRPPLFELGPQVCGVTASTSWQSIDNTSHLSSNADNSLGVEMPAAEPDDAMTTTMQTIATSSSTTTSIRNRRIHAGHCASQELSSSSPGSAISPDPQNMSGM